MLLAGKCALVTGGGSGIGRATALAMAREGARVAVADLTETAASSTVAAINAAGGQAIAIGADIAEEAAVAAMIARVIAAFGRIDCAFNNAGISSRVAGPVGQRTHEIALPSWDRVIAVNLTGVFLCMKHQLPHMLAQAAGAIVNTASIAGLIGLNTAAAYVASKHGVIGLTKTAALEYAADGVRVNCVCPGYIQTPMTDDTVRARGPELLAKVAAGRLGQPEEIAEMVVFLCSDRASFVTGAAHIVDGGYTAA